MKQVRTWLPAIVGSLAVIAGCGIAVRSLAPLPLMAQTPQVGVQPAPDTSLVYQCPMDPDVRSDKPGKCPRCGMTMVAGIPEPTEYPMAFSVAPQPIRVGAHEIMTFGIHDPQNGKPTNAFSIVHEKLFHLFVVSQDLGYFEHDHPVLHPDAEHAGKEDQKSFFTFDQTFPRPGMYRILGDFYPTGGTPQLAAKTVFVPGGSQKPAKLTRDYGPLKTTGLKDGAPVPLPDGVAMTGTITTEPPEPIAGIETRIFLHLDNADGIEPYIGAWAHMLAVSDDTIDLIHSHPFQADGTVTNGGTDMQFHIYFGREHVYRVWLQFQKKKVVHTIYFDIPVKELD